MLPGVPSIHVCVLFQISLVEIDLVVLIELGRLSKEGFVFGHIPWSSLLANTLIFEFLKAEFASLMLLCRGLVIPLAVDKIWIYFEARRCEVVVVVTISAVILIQLVPSSQASTWFYRRD